MQEIDDYLERTAESRTDPGWFHPSDLHHPCDAYLAFAYLGSPKIETTTARVQRIFDMGNGRDAYWKQYMRGAGLTVCGSDDDRRFEIKRLHLRGECDDIIRHPITGQIYIAEFKTKKQELWNKMAGPDESHLTQTQCYMAGHGINDTLIFYENKNTQAVKVFHIPFDVEMWEGIAQRIQRVLSQIETAGQEPVRTPTAYCPYTQICASHDFTKPDEDSSYLSLLVRSRP